MNSLVSGGERTPRPVDATTEIRLEPICLAHAPELQRIATDPKVAIPAGLDVPLPATWADSFCTWRARAFVEREALTFALLRCNVLVGCVGIHGVDPRAESGELAIWLARAHWGRSVASAATRAILRLGFEELRLRRVRARCAHDNHRALELLKRVGFSLDPPPASSASSLLHLSIRAATLSSHRVSEH